MSFCPLDWDILISSFKNIKLSFSNYPSFQALEVHKYEDIENALKIKDWKMPQENQMISSLKAKCPIYRKPCFKFELGSFLETYLRKFIDLEHERTSEDPFSQGPLRGPFGRSWRLTGIILKYFGKYISKCPNLMEKMPPL